MRLPARPGLAGCQITCRVAQYTVRIINKGDDRAAPETRIVAGKGVGSAVIEIDAPKTTEIGKAGKGQLATRILPAIEIIGFTTRPTVVPTAKLDG